MTWALQRQILLVIFFLLIIFGLGYWVSYPYFHRPPTCMDNKQNGTETGVDCGGICTRACIQQVDPVSILWARAFRVVPGRYNAVAYLENHNKNDAIEKINYRFRFADADNIYIGKREGSTIVPPEGKFAVFEPAIDVGNSIPVFTTFEFTSAPQWVQVPPYKVSQLKVFANNINLQNADTSPLLSATITNNSLYYIPNINVIAILYDKVGNAVSASRTYIDSLRASQSAPVTFTWPEPFGSQVVAKEIIPIFDIGAVELRGN
jgi:hypothetical protein